eukprot:507147-Prorocentrum_minimum.AAC.2
MDGRIGYMVYKLVELVKSCSYIPFRDGRIRTFLIGTLERFVRRVRTFAEPAGGSPRGDIPENELPPAPRGDAGIGELGTSPLGEGARADCCPPRLPRGDSADAIAPRPRLTSPPT